MAHRLSEETFAVSTRDARVEVRGTQFVVATGPAGSSVRVLEGLVAVQLADGSRRIVGAGESTTTETARRRMARPIAAARGAGRRDVDTLRAPSCAAIARGLPGDGARGAPGMRGGDNERALRLVAGASRSARDSDAECARELLACEDELRYLHAEALRGAGRIDDAVAAYKALNRPGAPAAMRQNALYAAAELERRKGRLREAGRRLRERARGRAPGRAARGGAGRLHGERARGRRPRARAGAFARRYLAEFPSGRAAPAARRLVDGAAAPGRADPRPE